MSGPPYHLGYDAWRTWLPADDEPPADPCPECDEVGGHLAYGPVPEEWEGFEDEWRREQGWMCGTCDGSGFVYRKCDA